MGVLSFPAARCAWILSYWFICRFFFLKPAIFLAGEGGERGGGGAIRGITSLVKQRPFIGRRQMVQLHADIDTVDYGVAPRPRVRRTEARNFSVRSSLYIVPPYHSIAVRFWIALRLLAVEDLLGRRYEQRCVFETRDKSW